MATDFSIKRYSHIFFAVIWLAVIGVLTCYAYYLAEAKFVWMGKRFYFLISSDTHVDAATHITRLEGGAGYLLADSEGEYTVYSVYLNDDVAHAVQVSMRETSCLVEKEVKYLVFKGREKSLAEVYKGALNGLYGSIEVLSQSISMLEGGMPQQTYKRILRILEKQFGYMANVYKKQYPTFSEGCEALRECLDKVMADVIFCKDVRFLLCMACDNYLQLASAFVL